MKINTIKLLFTASFVLFSAAILAQCPIPANDFGFGIAPSPGNSVVIGTCNFVGEYQTVSGVQSGHMYTVNYSGGAGVHVVVYVPMNVPIAWGDTTAQFTATQTGTYYSAVFVDSTCNGNDPNFTCNTSLWTNTTSNANIQSLEHSTVSVFPNPTKDFIAIEFEGNEAELIIHDFHGKIMLTDHLTGSKKINMNSFSVGVYLFELQVEGRTEIGRVLKE